MSNRQDQQKLEYSGAALNVSGGGGGALASHVPTFRYAVSALQEMRTLLASVRDGPHLQAGATKLIFQTLPKQMRRRAMSHHPKRLPRRYRAAHCSQMAKAGRPHATRRPSRKCRRRPSNLLRAYVRRQRRHVWLETHIWHARRFHMQERWGYRLPYASCDKTYRAAYRATAQHCLLQDISYYSCLEICGKLPLIRAGFARLSGGGGLSIAARTFTSGRREGSIALFRDGQYPESALARCEFMWRPLPTSPMKEEEDAIRTLWLWVHPNAYAAVLEELIKVFALVSTKNVRMPLPSEEVKVEEEGEQASPTLATANQKATAAAHSSKLFPNKTKTTKCQRQLQFMTKTQACERIKRYANSEQTIHLNDLKDTMIRFRLTGPLSQAVLTQAFKTYSPTKTNTTTTTTTTSSWFQQAAMLQQDFLQQHVTQADYWRRCGSLQMPAALMSNMILALNICDPRLQRPQKRTKAAQAMAPPLVDCDTNDFLAQSPPDCLPHNAAFWNIDIRDRISDSMLTQHEYCELRRRHAAVPGAEIAFESSASSSMQLQPVPVLLIQRPGAALPQYKRLGYASGWDVIAPSGYGMPIWLSLIMWGAKAGGLRESESVARELGSEEHLPDTVPGHRYAAERHAELRARYFRLPPNKRCNYRKFAVVSPFRAPFAQLVRDWLPSTNNAISTLPTKSSSLTTSNFHVLRDRGLLQELNAYLFHKHNSNSSSTAAVFPALPPHCLVQLQLRMKTRGNPGGRGNQDDFTMICLPTRADLKRNLRQIKYENHEPVYTEPLQPDAGEKERRCLRLQHKRLLKRLRARRVRAKRKQQETSTTRVHIRPAETAPLVATQLSRMCALWLPDEEPLCATPFSVRKQCSREVFGYAAHAHFSYTEATVCAVAYVCGEGLRQLCALSQQARLKQPMCLVRGSSSRHYRFASFKLNVDI